MSPGLRQAQLPQIIRLTSHLHPLLAQILEAALAVLTNRSSPTHLECMTSGSSGSTSLAGIGSPMADPVAT